MIRRAETEIDLERCVEIFNAVHPDDGLAQQDIRNARGHCLLQAGSGYAYLSSSSIPAGSTRWCASSPAHGDTVSEPRFSKRRPMRPGSRDSRGSSAGSAIPTTTGQAHGGRVRLPGDPGGTSNFSDACGWATANGYTELITATTTTNRAMRRVNAKLGYVERLGAIIVEREL
jgi:hypothetical protein